MKRKIIFALILPLITLFIAGCSAKNEEKFSLVLPAPPEEPKLFFVQLLRGESNFVDDSALDAFIGEDAPSSGKNLFKPYGATAENGVVYVTDTAMGIVFVIDENRSSVTYLGDKPSGKLSLPVGVSVGRDGIIYVSDAKQKKIFGYKRDGKLVYAIGEKGEFGRPSGIVVNKELNRLYVVDTSAHNVKIYDLATNEQLATFGKRGVGDAEFNYPTNIAVDRRNNNIAIVDTQNFRVQIFDQDGNFISRFGSIGDRPGMFARPKGIGIDTEGHIYVSDAAFNNLQVFDTNGTVLLYFGGAGFDPGNFYLPTGVFVDESDRVYAVDSFNARVQIFQYMSKTWREKNPLKYQELKKFD